VFDTLESYSLQLFVSERNSVDLKIDSFIVWKFPGLVQPVSILNQAAPILAIDKLSSIYHETPFSKISELIWPY
jgi:hypothetical protein